MSFRKIAKNTVASLGVLALGACTTLTPVSIAQVISVAQQVAQQVCNVIPDAEAIANIIAAGNPLLVTGTAIGNAICAAIAASGQTPPAAMSHRAVMIGGARMKLAHWKPNPVSIGGVAVPFLQ